MKNILARLTSRKLWLAVGSFVVFIASKQYPEAMGVVLAYIGVQGAVDARQPSGMVFPGSKSAPVEDIDTSGIATGTGRIKMHDEE